jgi:hypothetical protein
MQLRSQVAIGNDLAETAQPVDPVTGKVQENRVHYPLVKVSLDTRQHLVRVMQRIQQQLLRFAPDNHRLCSGLSLQLSDQDPLLLLLPDLLRRKTMHPADRGANHTTLTAAAGALALGFALLVKRMQGQNATSIAHILHEPRHQAPSSGNLA